MKLVRTFVIDPARMPVLRVNPNSNLRLSYSVPRQASVSVKVEIEMGRTADVLVLDHENLDAFDEERPRVPTYGHARNARLFRREVVVDRGQWWLVVVNRDPRRDLAFFVEVAW